MTDNIDDDTLIDKADALMRRRGFNANPDLKETTEALSLTEDLENTEDNKTDNTLPKSDTTITSNVASHPEETSDQLNDNSTSPEKDETIAPPPVLNTSASLIEQDIPTLTDVVQDELHTPLHPIRFAQTQAEFHGILNTWLEEALPEVIATTLDKLKDQLTRELQDRFRAEFRSETTTHPETER